MADNKDKSTKKEEKKNKKNKTEDVDFSKLSDEDIKKLVIKEVIDFVVYIAFLIVCVFLIINFVGQRTVVNGESMYDTLDDGDNLWVNKFTYHFKDPERFDIVVFPVYDSDQDRGLSMSLDNSDNINWKELEEKADHKDEDYEYFIKRIIGLPGETVRIDQEGNIYINGERIVEDYGYETIDTDHIGRAYKEVRLGEDEYFVMGDNRNASEDSRYLIVGNLNRKRIKGKAVFRLWPLSEFGKIE